MYYNNKCYINKKNDKLYYVTIINIRSARGASTKGSQRDIVYIDIGEKVIRQNLSSYANASDIQRDF